MVSASLGAPGCGARTPKWSQCAVKITYSLSLAPASLATTFGAVLRDERCCSVAAAFSASGTALKPRFDAASQSAWVRFPDREFRLDAVPGAAEGRYSNGRTTLNTKGDEAFLTEGAEVSFDNCKRAAQD